MSDQYLGFIEQTLHYFDRPHQAIVTEPVECEAAWRGDALPSLAELAYHLSPREQQELKAAVGR